MPYYWNLKTMQLILAIKVLLGLLFVVSAQLSSDPHELLNWCLDGINHKKEPGPEDQLHSQCTPWKNHSCCTKDITVAIHTSRMYNFTWEHCDHYIMSEKCQRHFTQDLCFYECEPSLGPWMVKVEMKIRKERYYGVPLCASDCDAWFDACRNDYTCVDNWTRKFKWINGRNTCPPGTTCRTFKEVFNDSKNFCENVWDGSYVYTPDNAACMRLWFNGALGNPNVQVAKLKVDELFAKMNKASQTSISSIPITVIFILLIVLQKFVYS